MINLMRALLALGLSSLATFALGQSCNPAEPRTDPGSTFSAFASLERLEVRGGRPGNQDWEWGLGTNTQQTGSFVKSYLDWVSGRVLTYTLSYDGAGAGTFTVYDGATQLTTQTWNDPLKPLRAGNALKLYVKSSADSGTATVQATVATINGLPAPGSIKTAGNSQFSDATMYWYFPGMAGGFTVTGTVTLTYPGTNPPQGSRLNFIVTAGNITCQQASAPPGMYFIHADHLNTPRLVANQSGQTVWRWDQQEPFGVNVPDENPSGLGVFEQPLRFPGQYFDKETNLAYNVMRDYDASIGRYIQSDPIGLNGGLSTYSYVAGDPLRASDPTGENPVVFFAYAVVQLYNWIGQDIKRQLKPPPSTPPETPPSNLYTNLFSSGLSPSGQNVCAAGKLTPSDCYERCKHLLPSPSGDLQASEYRKCYRECIGSL